jgi:predicted ATP-grasp superfamily ATP-dependent carboligase
MKPGVLVAHSAYWLGIARLPVVLQEAGATVTVMCPQGSFLERTRFADRRIIVSGNLATFADRLRAHLRENDYALVILADDDLIAELSKHADDPCVARVLPATSASAFEMMVSKICFLDICKAYGLPVSPSETVRTLEEAQAAAATFGYPVMLKLSTGSGGAGVKKIDGPLELERDFLTFSGGEPLTIERFVTGPIAGAEVLYDRGVPLCWSAYYKEKRWPGEFGPSAVRRVMTHPSVGHIARRIGEVTGLHGFAVLCFIHDEQTGDLVLLETNFRPGTGMHFRGPIRRMFVGALHSMLFGAPYEGRATPGAENRIIHMFPQDLQRTIAERDYRGMFELATGSVFADLPYDDVGLLRAHIVSIVRRFPFMQPLWQMRQRWRARPRRPSAHHG